MPAALETLLLSRPVLAEVVKRDLCAVGEAGSAGPPEALAHGRHETNRPSLPVLALALASAPDSATVADTTRILGRGRLSARLSRRTTLPLFVSPRPLDSVGCATTALSPVPAALALSGRSASWLGRALRVCKSSPPPTDMIDSCDIARRSAGRGEPGLRGSVSSSTRGVSECGSPRSAATTQATVLETVLPSTPPSLSREAPIAGMESSRRRWFMPKLAAEADVPSSPVRQGVEYAWIDGWGVRSWWAAQTDGDPGSKLAVGDSDTDTPTIAPSHIESGGLVKVRGELGIDDGVRSVGDSEKRDHRFEVAETVDVDPRGACGSRNPALPAWLRRQGPFGGVVGIIGDVGNKTVGLLLLLLLASGLFATW